MHPSATLSWVFSEEPPASIHAFTVSGKLDSTMADISAGVDILTAGGMVFKLDYNGLYSGNVRSHSGSFKFSYPF